jgi:hypothetical protein
MSAPADGEWSGLETDGMKEARCSLLLPVDEKYQPKIKTLPSQKVVVFQDRAVKPSVGLHGEKDFYRDFEGATIMQLEPVPSTVRQKTMPVTLTVAGRCHMTNENYHDFGIMMRTKTQSEAIGIPPNGGFDWPDVRSFLMCPVCGQDAVPPRDDKEVEHKEYWLLLYPLLQLHIRKGSKMVVATRTICRLTCMPCMKELLGGMKVTIKQRPETEENGNNQSSFALSAMEILEEAGTASFLQDKPPRPQSYPNVDDALDAWTLYCLWEHSGAWEALQNDYKSALVQSMKATAHEENDGEEMESDPHGRKCGNPKCNNRHGMRDPFGTVVHLLTTCEKCERAYYCSPSCKQAADEHHREICAKWAKEKKIKQVQCSKCQIIRPYKEMKKCKTCRSATCKLIYRLCEDNHVFVKPLL